MIGRPFLPSILADSKVKRSLDFLCSLQARSGMVPWYRGGRADPWNHCEAALALAMGGRLENAWAAAKWLLERQNSDGSWCHFHLELGIAEPRRDTNTVAYPVVLVSVLRRLSSSSRRIVPYVEMAVRALDFVVSHQREDGSLPWAVDPDGTPHHHSLVAASSSALDSLLVGATLLEDLGVGRPQRYRDAAAALANSLALRGPRYRDTSEWAMDGYYPILAGASVPYQLSDGFMTSFHRPEWGIRCMLSNPWYSAAETAETAMALHISGEMMSAVEVFASLERFRSPGGGYLTGLVYPTGASFPRGEESAYSVAAVIISSYVLAGKPEAALGETLLGLVCGAGGCR